MKVYVKSKYRHFYTFIFTAIWWKKQIEGISFIQPTVSKNKMITYKLTLCKCDKTTLFVYRSSYVTLCVLPLIQLVFTPFISSERTDGPFTLSVWLHEENSGNILSTECTFQLTDEIRQLPFLLNLHISYEKINNQTL